MTALEEEEFDAPLGTGTGAAVIFGTTGGVMEAALRTCYYVLTGENPSADETFKAVRALGSDKPWIEAEYQRSWQYRPCRSGQRSGQCPPPDAAPFAAVRWTIEFVEVMACPGGCVGGGGQPIHFNEERAAQRGQVLYNYDSANKMRFSHENPDVQALYAEYLGKPCGELSHHLLHTDHHGWSLPMAPVFDEDVRLN